MVPHSRTAAFPPSFTALDFETADHSRASACAIGIVRVERGRIVRRESRLIRPPTRTFLFTWVHGITAEDVRGAPTFPELFPEIAPLFEGVDFLAAHNAAFDRSVMNACCERWGLERPSPPMLCTVRLSRRIWNIRPTKLPDVCRYLGIDLNHHEALSDAEACARIVLAAAEESDPATFKTLLRR